MKTYVYETGEEVREAFWRLHTEIYQDTIQRLRDYPEDVRQNRHNAYTRTAFVDFVDFLQKNGEISEELAKRVTL